MTRPEAERATDWLEPPARLYPHRYAYCVRCSRVVRDFQHDGVWRDREGWTTCNQEPSSTERHEPPDEEE